MNKTKYLKKEHVSGFLAYMKKLLDGEDFEFYFPINNSKDKWGKGWKDFNNGDDLFKIITIKEAYDKYYWPFNKNKVPNYKGNKKNLDQHAQYIKKESTYTKDGELNLMIKCFCSQFDKNKKNLLQIRTINHLLKVFKSPDKSLTIKNEICKDFGVFFFNVDCDVLTINPIEFTGEESQLIGALDCLEWGGVLRKNSSTEWLFNQYKNSILNEQLKEAVLLLIGDTEEEVINNFKNKTGKFLMNSGMTKIYSLYSGESIIYDGRVGAALGLLVRKYLENKGLDSVPQELDFLWGDTQNKKKKGCRNPSKGLYNFKQLRNDSSKHALMNLRANWIFKELVSGEFWGISKYSDKLRALEAALFMIGYDVSHV